MSDSREQERRRLRGEYLRDRLAAERWTSRQAAEKTGIANSTLSNRLNGVSDFQVEEVIAIAGLLGVDAGRLFAELVRVSNGADAPPRTASEIIADNVLQVLSESRLSRRQAAAELGWSHPYLNRRINGLSEFNATDLHAIAALAGVPVARFFEGT